MQGLARPNPTATEQLNGISGCRAREAVFVWRRRGDINWCSWASFRAERIVRLCNRECLVGSCNRSLGLISDADGIGGAPRQLCLTLL